MEIGGVPLGFAEKSPGRMEKDFGHER